MAEQNDVGRPTVMTDEVLRKLKEAFAFGCTDEEACYYAEIGKTALYDYQNEHPEFTEQKEALKQRPILLARQEVINGLKGNPELALKFLERKKKDEFSLRKEFAGVKEQPLIDANDPKVLTTLLKVAQELSENASSIDTTPTEPKKVSKTTN